MKEVSYLTCSVTGTTSGEHSGHKVPHPPCTIDGVIIGNCSSLYFINGLPVATLTSTTLESDCCCGGGSGVVSSCASFVTVDGKILARIDDIVTPHNGTAKISTGSSFVFSD